MNTPVKECVEIIKTMFEKGDYVNLNTISKHCCTTFEIAEEVLEVLKKENLVESFKSRFGIHYIYKPSTPLIIDCNDITLKNGDVINLHQTINGQNIFVILDVENLDVRYAYDLSRQYEYDKKDLFRRCKISGTVEFEKINNIYDDYLVGLCQTNSYL